MRLLVDLVCRVGARTVRITEGLTITNTVTVLKKKKTYLVVNVSR